MDQQDGDVRRLCAHHFTIPELGHGGDGFAIAGRAEAAGTVSRPGAGRSVRPAVRAAGVRWIGSGPNAAAQGAAIAQRCRLTSRTASGCCRMARPSRSSFCSTNRRFQPHHAPLSRILARSGSRPAADGRCGPVPRACGRFRLRHDDRALQYVGDARGQPFGRIFSSQSAATKGSFNLAGIADPAIDALIEKSMRPIPGSN